MSNGDSRENYRTTIGLEIHAELKTATKMFCSSKNDPDETRSNVNICPVCLAHPGTLPVINREAVRHVLRVGAALGSTLADYTEFDRKNYFYPDLPKGYQISQYEYPLVSGGSLNDVAITQVHLEEDTASSTHDESIAATLIDYNRSGVPLMELVTEPVITSAVQAGNFARELQILLRYLGASDANMEKGEMRVEANVSVSKTDTFGTKVEIKNLNSFRAMERAVSYEIDRQITVLEGGGHVVQQTLGWDEAKQTTFPQRIKEGSSDYRYFPDPDLPMLKISEIAEFSIQALLSTLPELPSKRRERYMMFGIKQDDVELYLHDEFLGGFFEDLVRMYDGSSLERVLLASNYLANDLVKMIRDIHHRDQQYRGEIPISASNFKKIIDLLYDRKISSRGAKDLLVLTIEEKRDPEDIAKDHSLLQSATVADVERSADVIIAANVSAAADYKAGKVSVLQYLVGQTMKAMKGGDPNIIKEILARKLDL